MAGENVRNLIVDLQFERIRDGDRIHREANEIPCTLLDLDTENKARGSPPRTIAPSEGWMESFRDDQWPM